MIANAEQSDLRPPLVERELLVPERGVHVESAAQRHAEPVADIYRRAYRRGDFFAGRYADPEREIFNPDWLGSDFGNLDHHWFVFTDGAGEVIGVTGWFHDADVDRTPVLTSDETQIDPGGRGIHIMDRFFKRIVPDLEASGAQLTTEFVLTPESKGLRRTLQSELGMTAIGIRPHALRHPKLDITRSEITATKFRELDPEPVELLPEFTGLYQIVRSQLPELREPNIVSPINSIPEPTPAERYEEAAEGVPADDPAAQQLALEAGFQPVVYDPQRHSFTVARFPAERPDLDFIIKGENVEANKRLVEYLNHTLYRDADTVKNETTEA